MVEEIRISPEEVRGYGNVIEEHEIEDFSVNESSLAKISEKLNGILTTTYKLIYNIYGLIFDFDKGGKQLYLQTTVTNSLSLGFDSANKQLYLLDEGDMGLILGFDEDTKELYITDDIPSAVLFYDDASTDNSSNYTLADSYCSLSYNNDGYYVLSKTNLSGTSGVKINTMTFPKNVKISLDVYMTTSGNTQPKILLKNPASTYGYVPRLTYTNDKASIIQGNWNSEGNSITGDVSFDQSLNTWYTLEFTHDDGALTFNIYQAGTLVKTLTATGSLSIADTGNEIGVCISNDNGKTFRFKNLKIEEI